MLRLSQKIMRKAGFEKETAALLELGRPLSVADFMMDSQTNLERNPAYL